MPFDAKDQAEFPLSDEIRRASADMLLRLEQLMLSAPLHAAEVNKNARARSIGDKTLLDRIDMRFMVLDAMDYILDAMVLRQGTREKDLVAHLCARVLDQAQDAWEDDQETIARATIDALRNNDGRKFSEKVWDGSSHRLVEFHLVVPFETPDRELLLKLSDRAIALLTQSLRVTAQDQQQIIESLLRELIQKGRFNDAEIHAKNARTNSIRFQEEILDLLERARRKVGSISWTRDVRPKTDEALVHIAETIERERALLDQVQRRKMEVSSSESLATLDNLEKLIQNASERHSRLQGVIRRAAAEWRELQIAAFKPRAARCLPDLHNEILPVLMQMPVKAVMESADDILAGILPPSIHPIFDIGNALWILSETPPERAEDTAAEKGEIVEAPPRFDKALRREVRDWLKAKKGLVSMSGLLKEAERDGKSELFREFLFYRLEIAIHPLEIEGLVAEENGAGTFADTFVSGSDVRYTANFKRRPARRPARQHPEAVES
jgi:hypothetical protein